MSRGPVLAAGALVCAGGWVAGALWLPDPAPMHFGGSGDVDRWASKASYLWLTGGVGLGLAVLFWALSRWIGRLPLEWLNVPHKPWWTATPARQRRLRAMLAADNDLIGGATLAFVGVVQLLIVRAAQDAAPRLGVAMWVSLALYLALVIGWAGYAALGRYRPRDAG